VGIKKPFFMLISNLKEISVKNEPKKGNPEKLFYWRPGIFFNSSAIFHQI
jgi:hypothetical protein